MKKYSAWLVGALAFGVMVSNVQAQRFFQLSMAPEFQIVDSAEAVSGIRLAIWSENAAMSGLDLGIANTTRGDFNGVGAGIFNQTDGDVSGIQLGIFGATLIAGELRGWSSGTFFNEVGGDVTGLQGGLVTVTRGDAVGLIGGGVSLADAEVSGWQMGLLFAKTGGHMKGLQTGLVNQAGTASGLQLGLVNMTDDMYGIQIGLVNYIRNSSIPFFVIANAKF